MRQREREGLKFAKNKPLVAGKTHGEGISNAGSDRLDVMFVLNTGSKHRHAALTWLHSSEMPKKVAFSIK
jgi:hypothetical protein